MKNPFETASVLEELGNQPEDVRRIFIYAICQTMVESGYLEFKGTSVVDGVGTLLLYRNPDSDKVFEIIKPDIAPEDEEQMRKHIRQLLEKQN